MGTTKWKNKDQGKSLQFSVFLPISWRKQPYQMTICTLFLKEAYKNIHRVPPSERMKTRVKTTFTVILVPSSLKKKTTMSDYNVYVPWDEGETSRFSFYSHLLCKYESGLSSQTVRHSDLLMKKRGHFGFTTIYTWLSYIILDL